MPAVDYLLPGGLDWDELAELLVPLAASPALLGADVTIYNPSLDPTASARRGSWGCWRRSSGERGGSDRSGGRPGARAAGAGNARAQVQALLAQLPAAQLEVPGQPDPEAEGLLVADEARVALPRDLDPAVPAAGEVERPRADDPRLPGARVSGSSETRSTALPPGPRMARRMPSRSSGCPPLLVSVNHA